MTVKSWFLNKNFPANERIAIAGVEPTVEKETEKAVFLCWATEYGKISKWVPKSCTEETAPLSAGAQKMIDDWRNHTIELYNTMVKGVKVKKLGGRKIFTIVSDVHLDCVYVEDKNGKQQQINIHNLQLA